MSASTHRSRGLFTVGLVGIAAIASLAGCASSDPERPGATTDATAPSVANPSGTDTRTPPPIVADRATSAATLGSAYCDGLVAMDRQPTSDPGLHARGVVGAIDAMAAVAPTDVTSSLGVLRTSFRNAASTGETVLIGPTAVSRLDARLAAAHVHRVGHTGCGFTQLAVTAIDFAFEGLPRAVQAGRVSIEFTNLAPTETHEIVIVRKHDGVAAPIRDLLAEGESAFARVEIVGGAMIEAGGTTYAVVDLEPGEYAAICFVPTGDAATGDPHFAHGMAQDFTVHV